MDLARMIRFSRTIAEMSQLPRFFLQPEEVIDESESIGCR